MSTFLRNTYSEEWKEINRRADDLKFVVKAMSLINDIKTYNDLYDTYNKRKDEFLDYLKDLVVFKWDSVYIVPLKSIYEESKFKTALWYYEPLDIVRPKTGKEDIDNEVDID